MVLTGHWIIRDILLFRIHKIVIIIVVLIFRLLFLFYLILKINNLINSVIKS